METVLFDHIPWPLSRMLGVIEVLLSELTADSFPDAVLSGATAFTASLDHASRWPGTCAHMLRVTSASHEAALCELALVLGFQTRKWLYGFDKFRVLFKVSPELGLLPGLRKYRGEWGMKNDFSSSNFPPWLHIRVAWENLREFLWLHPQKKVNSSPFSLWAEPRYFISLHFSKLSREIPTSSVSVHVIIEVERLPNDNWLGRSWRSNRTYLIT